MSCCRAPSASVTTMSRTWIDPINGWLVVDASGAGHALTTCIKLLLKAIDKHAGGEPARAALAGRGVMTEWLEH